jgi:2-methylcitrate dehydratase PrpD
MSATPNTERIAQYIAGAPSRAIPDHVLDAARLCLADWLGVALGAIDEPAAKIVHATVVDWHSAGRSSLLSGGTAAAPFAALVNGTLAHCLDFDDTYVKGITHTSSPVWAAVCALGEDVETTEAQMLKAFVTGFEVSARAGGGLGEAVTARGWHGTGIFGRLGAAAAAAALLELDADAARHALGIAATQTSGLTASFGTMSKPFHAGKAAMDGILAVQLAKRGFRAAENLLDPGAGLDNAVVQDRSVAIAPADFSGWEILENSFKPYAACHLTHPAVDAARAARAREPNVSAARSITAEVSPLANQVTGEKSGSPRFSLEGKFDLKYCVALALHGYPLSSVDFQDGQRPPREVLETARKVSVEARPDLSFTSARLRVRLSDGQEIAIAVPVATGHPGNPMTWGDMWQKFRGLAEPRLSAQAEPLFQRIRTFGRSERASLLESIRV